MSTSSPQSTIASLSPPPIVKTDAPTPTHRSFAPPLTTSPNVASLPPGGQDPGATVAPTLSASTSGSGDDGAASTVDSWEFMLLGVSLCILAFLGIAYYLRKRRQKNLREQRLKSAESDDESGNKTKLRSQVRQHEVAENINPFTQDLVAGWLSGVDERTNRSRSPSTTV